MVTPSSRRAMALYAVGRGLSERRASHLCSTPRSGLRYRSQRERRDRRLCQALEIVAREEPTWGYRLVAGYLKLRGWSVGPKRVHRLWRLRGHSLPAPAKRRKIRTGSTLRPKATYRNDVWAWDLVHDCYGEGQPFRCLTVKDEATSYCLAVEPGRHLDHVDIKALLRKLIGRYGRPRWIRSDNGSELIAAALQEAMRSEGVEPITIDPGKPWQNGSNESLNGTFRRECLDAEIFPTFAEAKVVIAAWRRRYNRKRPHSSLGYITPEMAYYGKRKP